MLTSFRSLWAVSDVYKSCQAGPLILTTHGNSMNIETLVDYVNTLRANKETLSMPEDLPNGIQIHDFASTKTVVKPWGFELWLAHGPDLPYALKMIYIKQGSKTSLQYHKQKTEHNVLFSGEARLYYQNENGILCNKIYRSGAIIEVQPPSIHRLEALTDLMLIEVSSNHLDDVFRLQDDSNRPDGKIESEHVLNK